MPSEKVRHSDLDIWGGRVKPLGCVLKKKNKPHKKPKTHTTKPPKTPTKKKTLTNHTYTNKQTPEAGSQSYALRQSWCTPVCNSH